MICIYHLKEYYFTKNSIIFLFFHKTFIFFTCFIDNIEIENNGEIDR